MENERNYNEERFDSFLNKTIIYSSKSYFKKQMNTANKEKTIINDENYGTFLEKTTTLNTLVDNIEVNIELNNALKSLSAIEQAVIFLLFQENLTQDEAGKILEICSKSVSRIKLRAINKLKNILKEGFEDEK